MSVDLQEGNAILLSESANEYVDDFSPEVPLLNVKASSNEHKAVFVSANENKKFAFVNLRDKRLDVTGSVPSNGDLNVQLITLDTTVFQITVQPVSRVSLTLALGEYTKGLTK